MDKSAADSYVYAKASGMLAKSFIGTRATRLFTAHSLQELWSLLFKTSVPVVPEVLLAKALEKEAQKKFIEEYTLLLSNYEKPSPILVALLHLYDYNNIKEIGAALCFKEKKIPNIVDISPYNIINYKKWPNISAMTDGSPFSWYNKIPLPAEQQKNDYKLDCAFVEEVRLSCKKLSSSCKETVEELLKSKAIMDNILWALRLRVYYEMDKDSIIENLAYESSDKSKDSVLVVDAIKILDWELDNYEQWRKWKYSKLLNPHEEGVVWSVDPRWVSNAYKKIFIEKVRVLFHRYPFTECPLVCWYFLKQNELDAIRTASESLRLHIPVAQAMQVAGVTEVN